ncbi:LIM and SH3 domain protein 1 [Onthophagus taurus]|uniref:LIM and SH3 domain protein 1 n=1 Tax=Onthophagus taurus TaxID=166361 RepID=UPI000C20E697|nr:LIM and SH3 domain protein F42H10.3 [Onthophagus taurus]
MNKTCARCEKMVYPTEELKCLDKVWHKICFKCKECGMSLNMRNYKGFNKEPYCEAHIPKAKATPMAETPELKRIAENTKLQSNVKYHADFEKSKGKFTQVADDPETLRIKQNTKIISNVSYHGELQRKAEMEQRRTINENGTITYATGTLKEDQKNANLLQQSIIQQQQQQYNAIPTQQPQPQQQQQPQMIQTPQTPVQQNSQGIGKISDYDPQIGGGTPYSARNSQTVIYTSDHGAVNNPPQRHIGSVHDMDPVNHNYGSLGRVYRAMYDYEAVDDDEVSFLDGDLIINVSNIDGGWMTGEVQRTGQVGMLPANYVQLANI